MKLNEFALVLDEQLNRLQNEMQKINWQNLSSKNFLRELTNSIKELKNISQTINSIEEENSRKVKTDAPDAKELIKLIEEELVFLERNRELEEKKSDTKMKKVNEFEEETTEIYTELQQRIQSILLKARFFLERLNIFIKKHELNETSQKSIGENLLELLETKEKEIQKLRKDYKRIEKKTILGVSLDKHIAETEKEFIEGLIELKKSRIETEKELNSFKKTLRELNESFQSLKEKQLKINEHTKEIKNKSLTLITGLKKERDYARKTLLEIEAESLKLRNSYTSKLFSLENEKIKAKKEAEIKYENLIKKLKRKLEDNDALIKSLQEIIEDRNTEIKKLKKNR